VRVAEGRVRDEEARLFADPAGECLGAVLVEALLGAAVARGAGSSRRCGSVGWRRTAGWGQVLVHAGGAVDDGVREGVEEAVGAVLAAREVEEAGVRSTKVVSSSPRTKAG
jgi:hypothetical protein